jgi:hypothetical protein
MRRAWIPDWRFAIVAAAAILAVSVAYVWRRPESHPGTPEGRSVVSRSVGNPVPAVQPPRKSDTTSPSRTHKHPSSVVPSPVPSEAVPEVIILAEEHQALAKFVAGLPEEKHVALALTRPALAPTDIPVEIALLQIESVEVKSLEGTPRE